MPGGSRRISAFGRQTNFEGRFHRQYLLIVRRFEKRAKGALARVGGDPCQVSRGDLFVCSTVAGAGSAIKCLAGPGVTIATRPLTDPCPEDFKCEHIFSPPGSVATIAAASMTPSPRSAAPLMWGLWAKRKLLLDQEASTHLPYPRPPLYNLVLSTSEEIDTPSSARTSARIRLKAEAGRQTCLRMRNGAACSSKTSFFD